MDISSKQLSLPPKKMNCYIKRIFDSIRKSAINFLSECEYPTDEDPYAPIIRYYDYYSHYYELLSKLYDILNQYYEAPQIMLFDVDLVDECETLCSYGQDLFENSCFRDPSIPFKENQISADFSSLAYFEAEKMEKGVNVADFSIERLKIIYDRYIELFKLLTDNGFFNEHTNIGIELEFASTNHYEEIKRIDITNPTELNEFTFLIISSILYLQSYPKEEVVSTVFWDLMEETVPCNISEVRFALLFNRGECPKVESFNKRIQLLLMDNDPIWRHFMLENGFDSQSLYFDVEIASKVLYEYTTYTPIKIGIFNRFYFIVDNLYALSKEICKEENKEFNFWSKPLQTENNISVDILAHDIRGIDLLYLKRKFFKVAISIYRDCPRGKKLNLITILWWKWNNPNVRKSDRELFITIMHEGNSKHESNDTEILNMWGSISHFEERNRLRVFKDPQTNILCVGGPNIRNKEMLSEKEKEYSMIYNRIDQFMHTNNPSDVFNHNKVLKGEFDAWCQRKDLVMK